MDEHTVVLNLNLNNLANYNNTLVVIIVTRLWIRYNPSKSFRADDYWIAGAGVSNSSSYFTFIIFNNSFAPQDKLHQMYPSGYIRYSWTI